MIIDEVGTRESSRQSHTPAAKRYEEICANIRALDENSFRLLAFVPLVSGAAILTFLVGGEAVTAFFISPVGALVTFGLYRWECRNIQICKWLQERADAIEEQEFGVKEVGERQFAIRLPENPPKFKNSQYDDMDKFRGYRITQRKAEAVIYWTTIIAWLVLPWVLLCK